MACRIHKGSTPMVEELGGRGIDADHVSYPKMCEEVHLWIFSFLIQTLGRKSALQ